MPQPTSTQRRLRRAAALTGTSAVLILAMAPASLATPTYPPPTPSPVETTLPPQDDHTDDVLDRQNRRDGEASGLPPTGPEVDKAIPLGAALLAGSGAVLAFTSRRRRKH